MRLHDRQVEKFGGTSGIRDQGLLESALAQPQATFAGELLHATIYEQAAAYLFHLAMNHPFLDGNKRTAFAVMDVFLRLIRDRTSLRGCFKGIERLFASLLSRPLDWKIASQEPSATGLTERSLLKQTKECMTTGF
jgi:fido (protein-threonine AMPylation protein)